MTPERWLQIKELYYRAVELEAAERAILLDEACRDDQEMRSKVAALIAACEQPENIIIDHQAIEVAAELMEENRSESLIGCMIGHYQVISLIGEGGMGKVYLAQDGRLGRCVALKLLPARFTQEEGRVRRFQQEARAASALNHPNILTIHDIGQTDNGHFIATEFIEGDTLRSHITTGAMGLSEALGVAIQVASAIAAAHQAGIVHRDIKPENIMLRPDGYVKVLDFGLAKLSGPEAPPYAATTLMQVKTDPGMIMGTVAYMSPEQAKGAAIDARSDLFSLGVMLYECIAGRKPFPGKSPLEICAKVIHHDPPPPSKFNPLVPLELDALTLKAMAKDLDARYQSADDMLEDLRAAHVSLRAEDQKRPRTIPPRISTSSIRALTTLSGILRQPRVFTSVIILAFAIALLIFLRVLPGWHAAPYQASTGALYWYERGTASLRDGAYYEASKALERAVQVDDKFALAHARLAEAWTEMDYSVKANHEILRARSLVDDLSPLPRLEALYLQAITSSVLREFGPAIETYQEITRQVPDAEKSHAYLDLGRAYEKDEQIEKAIESYLEATRLYPSDAAAFLRMGILYGRQQNLRSAQEAFQQAEALYQALSNTEGVTEVFYQRAFLFKNLNKLPEARAQLEKALEMTRVTENQYQHIKALLVLSSVCAIEGNTVQAEQLANQAIEMARASGIENQATSGLIWLGNTFLASGRPDAAEKHYKEALELAQRDNGRLNEAWALLSLGSLCMQQRKTDEALRYIDQALPFYQQGGYSKWLSQALSLLGRAQRDKGEYDAALQAFKNGLRLAEEAGDLSQAALSHGDIGDVLANQEQYPEALRHYDECLRINRALNAKLYVGYGLMNRGGVLWQIGRYEEARAALDEASVVAAADRYLLAWISVVKARMELGERHFKEAKAKSRQAGDLAGEQFPDIAVQAKYTFGLSQARSGEPRAGAVLCNEAVELARSAGDPQMLSGALLAHAEAMIENAESQRSLKAALLAQESFARFGQQDSEWRAWLTAARAGQRLGDETAAREYARSAESKLLSLEQRWGPEAYSSYLARPDVRHFRSQLNQVINPHR
jgi:serine/threonine protein kinase/Tfp pilus assembly protein PilF